MTFRKMRVMMLRVIFVSFLGIPLFIAPSWSTESVADFITEWSGYVLLVAGLGLRMWSTLYIGQKKSRELITEGPYSICRNPLYLGTFAIALGAGLCFENIVMAAFVLGVMLPVHLLVARLEERHMRELFPGSYEEYRKSVPAFFPAFWRHRSAEELVVSTRVIRRAALDALLVMLVPPLGELAEVLHQRGILPVLWRVP